MSSLASGPFLGAGEHEADRLGVVCSLGFDAVQAALAIGVNAISIYLLKEIVPFNKIAKFFPGGAARYAGSFGPVLLEAGAIAVAWLLLLYLYRRRIFLRV